MKMPEIAPSQNELIKEALTKNIDIYKLLACDVPDAAYFSYSDIKYRALPKSIEELGGDKNTWWLYLVLSRNAKKKSLPLYSNNGTAFSYFLEDSDLSFIHNFDLNGGGSFEVDGLMSSKNDKDKYFMSSLMEESFSSSFIEGAISTREQAKKLISEKKEPKDKAERMILNNFKTMQLLQGWLDEDLTPELICRIHSSISESTLDEAKLGKFRSDDEIFLADDDGNIYHKPCQHAEIQGKIEELCSFINTANDSPQNFIHPIVKAIILHFSLAYIHPFCDGNGRTSRALFYWYMLKNKYWIVKYISISKIIIESGNRYYKSFLDTEIYNFDLNYFIKFQLEIFDRAVKAFQNYASKKKETLIDKTELFPILNELNSRQKDIALKLINTPFAPFRATIESYANTNNVAWETARKDLDSLLKKGILSKSKEGKSFVFIPAKTFLEQVKARS